MASDPWAGKGGAKGAFPGSRPAQTGPAVGPKSSNPAGGQTNAPKGK